jgi:hypothetical protein
VFSFPLVLFLIRLPKNQMVGATAFEPAEVLSPSVFQALAFDYSATPEESKRLSAGAARGA